MSHDFNEYEKDYLKRLEEKPEITNEEKIRRKEQEIKKRQAEEMIKNLSAKEFLILGALKQSSFHILTKFHPVEIADMYKKFFQCGLVEKLQRKLTWQEGVKFQNWLNSQEFERYQNNINKLLTWEEKDEIKFIYTSLDMKSNNVIDITTRGIKELEKKYLELNKEWKNIISVYEQKNRDQFRQLTEKNKSHLPLYLVMGLVSGSMLGIMMSKMDVNFEAYMQEFEFIHIDYTQRFTDTLDGSLMGDGFEM